jgi:hypothetical protein
MSKYSENINDLSGYMYYLWNNGIIDNELTFKDHAINWFESQGFKFDSEMYDSAYHMVERQILDLLESYIHNNKALHFECYGGSDYNHMIQDWYIRKFPNSSINDVPEIYYNIALKL